MRAERYSKFLETMLGELTVEVYEEHDEIGRKFAIRHDDGPLTFKAYRRSIKKTIEGYRQKCAALVALKKQEAKFVQYRDTAKETKEYCPNCCEDFEYKEWHYNFCPECGQKLWWPKN